MYARDIMTPEVAFCHPETNLASAAGLMWEHNCGALPVVDHHMHVTGMITDRDICIALATRNRLASEVTVGEVAADYALSCNPEENIHGVLSTMRDHKIRRVPVVNPDGSLAGIISIDDLVLQASSRKGPNKSAITYTDVVETQKSIAGHFRAVPTMESIATGRPAAEPALVDGNNFDFEE